MQSWYIMWRGKEGFSNQNFNSMLCVPQFTERLSTNHQGIKTHHQWKGHYFWAHFYQQLFKDNCNNTKLFHDHCNSIEAIHLKDLQKHLVMTVTDGLNTYLDSGVKTFFLVVRRTEDSELLKNNLVISKTPYLFFFFTATNSNSCSGWKCFLK